MELKKIQTTPGHSDCNVQMIQNNTESIPEQSKPTLNKQSEDNCEQSDGPLK